MTKQGHVLILRAGLLLACISAVVSAPPPAAATQAAPPPVAVTTTAWVYLPYVPDHWRPPALAFTYVPPYGSLDDLRGRVENVTPAEYRVAVYIYVSGWWTKPYWAQPLTPIRPDGTWTTDITTGGSDQYATRIAAFLVPDGYSPPLMSGGQALPEELYGQCAAQVMVERAPVFRTIDFSGRTWNVKVGDAPAGPGPNYFSDDPGDVWVDEGGRLHLTIRPRDGRWYCTEVFTDDPLGYGIYRFTLGSRVDLLDKNVVLGLFTWDDTAPQYSYREIDVEFSRWGEDGADNAQFVVQPWDQAGNRYRFAAVLHGDGSTHWFDWRAGGVHFSSYQGHPPDLGDQIESWAYAGPDVPPAGVGSARINLWLFGGEPPSDGQAVEVIVDAFEYLP